MPVSGPCRWSCLSSVHCGTNTNSLRENRSARQEWGVTSEPAKIVREFYSGGLFPGHWATGPEQGTCSPRGRDGAIFSSFPKFWLMTFPTQDPNTYGEGVPGSRPHS